MLIDMLESGISPEMGCEKIKFCAKKVSSISSPSQFPQCPDCQVVGTVLVNDDNTQKNQTEIHKDVANACAQAEVIPAKIKQCIKIEFEYGDDLRTWWDLGMTMLEACGRVGLCPQ